MQRKLREAEVCNGALYIRKRAPQLRKYRVILRIYKALLRTYKALLRVYSALFLRADAMCNGALYLYYGSFL